MQMETLSMLGAGCKLALPIYLCWKLMLLFGVQWLLEMCIRNRYRNDREDDSVIGAIIKDIQRLREGFHSCKFLYTAKRGNESSHIMATEGLKSRETIYLMDEVPGFVMREEDDYHYGRGGGSSGLGLA
ncbi:hypothetical protein Gogos_019579, partial [Gossypium gossypioides]|nr:hypothetical protein [Gossypium gossypioides]